MVLGEWDLRVALEDQLQQLPVSANFRFVSRAKRVDLEATQHSGHRIVAELRPLNSGGAFGRLDGGDLAKAGEAVRLYLLKTPPLPLELVDFPDEPGHLDRLCPAQRRKEILSLVLLC